MNEQRQQLRNRLELLEDIRCWLLDRIDGSEETKGDDGLISDFIRKLDALLMGLEPKGCPTPGACSCPGTIPDAERKEVMTARALAESIVERATVDTPRTDAEAVDLGKVTVPIKGEWVGAPFARTLERELIDLKQRLLPQYLGRAERAEDERNGLQKVISEMTAGVSELAQAWRDHK